MTKYEIMAIIDGKLEEANANAISSELVKLLDKTTNLKVTDWGNKQLAYPINKRTMGYYFIYNFEADDKDIIREFRRLTNNRVKTGEILRFLIINLDKNYGAKALNNVKKTKKALNRKQHFEEYQEKMRKQALINQKFDPNTKKRIDSNQPGTGLNANKKVSIKKETTNVVKEQPATDKVNE